MNYICNVKQPMMNNCWCKYSWHLITRNPFLTHSQILSAHWPWHMEGARRRWTRAATPRRVRRAPLRMERRTWKRQKRPRRGGRRSWLRWPKCRGTLSRWRWWIGDDIAVDKVLMMTLWWRDGRTSIAKWLRLLPWCGSVRSSNPRRPQEFLQLTNSCWLEI